MKKILFIALLAWIVLPAQIFAQGCEESGDDEGIKVFGFLQSQYEYQFLGDSVQKFMHGRDSESTFYFNRARLGVLGSIPYDFSYYFLAEFSPTLGGPYILDAFITYKRFAPWVNVSVGQFKMPFGLELQTPCHGLYSIDRSRVVNELASPFRDMGVLIWGGTGETELFGMHNKDIFKWQLAVTNGTGQNKFDDNSMKDFTGRLVFQPFEGFGVGGSYKTGRYTPVQAGLPQDERTRWGVELSFKRWGFLLQGEYISGQDKGSTLVGGGCGQVPTIVKGDFDKSGYWAALMYEFNFGFAPIIKYQYFKVESDVAGFQTQTQTEFILGFNYYLNDWTRLQFNYVMTTDSYIPDDAAFKKDYLQAQVQVRFN
jgi:phosphate-selective porin